MVVPSEFSSFVRDTGIRAFDRLAGQLDELDTPLRAVLRQWMKLKADQKEVLFDAAIGAIQAPEEPAPRPRARAAKPLKRFDPEEVELTLPKKDKKKKKAPAAAKPKKAARSTT